MCLFLSCCIHIKLTQENKISIFYILSKFFKARKTILRHCTAQSRINMLRKQICSVDFSAYMVNIICFPSGVHFLEHPVDLAALCTSNTTIISYPLRLTVQSHTKYSSAIYIHIEFLDTHSRNADGLSFPDALTNVF